MLLSVLARSHAAGLIGLSQTFDNKAHLMSPEKQSRRNPPSWRSTRRPAGNRCAEPETATRRVAVQCGAVRSAAQSSPRMTAPAPSPLMLSSASRARWSMLQLGASNGLHHATFIAVTKHVGSATWMLRMGWAIAEQLEMTLYMQDADDTHLCRDVMC